MNRNTPTAEQLKWRCNSLGVFHSRGIIENDIESGKGEKDRLRERYEKEIHDLIFTTYKDYSSEGEKVMLSLPVGTWGNTEMLAAKLATAQMIALMWAANKSDDINASIQDLSMSDAFNEDYEPREKSEIVNEIRGMRDKMDSIREYVTLQPSIMYQYCAFEEKIRALNWFLNPSPETYGEFHDIAALFNSDDN